MAFWVMCTLRGVVERSFESLVKLDHDRVTDGKDSIRRISRVIMPVIFSDASQVTDHKTPRVICNHKLPFREHLGADVNHGIGACLGCRIEYILAVP